MWNTISRLFAKSSKTAVQEAAAASPSLPPSTTTTSTITEQQKQQQELQQRTCNGVADNDAPADVTNAVHVFYDDATMDRGASADDRRRPAAAAAATAAAIGTAATAAADQQSAGGDSEHFSDTYDSRQVKASICVPLFFSKETLGLESGSRDEKIFLATSL